MSQLTRSGRILAIHDGRATIRVEPPAGCASCGGRGTCAGGRSDNATISLPVAASALPGAVVTLAIGDGALVRGALLAYLLPAVSMLAGAVALASAGDLAAIGGAAAGLALGLIALRAIGRWRPMLGELSVVADESIGTDIKTTPALSAISSAALAGGVASRRAAPQETTPCSPPPSNAIPSSTRTSSRR
jgi:sigma-E factor negative regulatory protein RseC